MNNNEKQICAWHLNLLEKEQASISSDEQCDEDDEDEEDDENEENDSYYNEDAQLPAVMVLSTEKTLPSQSTLTKIGSGATLSIRNAKSVSKKSKPIINVRAVIMFCNALSFYFHTFCFAPSLTFDLMVESRCPDQIRFTAFFMYRKFCFFVFGFYLFRLFVT